MAKERRDLPTLRTYAKDRATIEPIKRGKFLRDAGGPIVFLSAVAGAWWVGLHYSFFYAILSFLVVVGVIGSVVSSIEQSLRRPRSQEEKTAVEVHRLLKTVGNMGQQKVQTHIDPVAGQILEACAIQRERVIVALDSAAWEARSANEPWKSVRDQARVAAESAMDEALILCSPFVGSGKGVQESDEWSKVVSDFLEKGVGAAIRRVDKILAPKKPLDISQVPSPLRPAFDVATKLQSLADEVDSAGEAAAAETSMAGVTLDQALQNLRAVQQAEKELDDSIQQRLT